MKVNQQPSLPCRFCKTALKHTFVDLGMSPIANDYVPRENTTAMEPFYPLQVYVCSVCLLVQLPDTRREDEIFRADYAYFSSYSSSWLAHAKRYVDMITPRLGLTDKSLVVEVASNDGYLLQYFKPHHVPVLGIEPTANTARVAREKGIPSIEKFFGVDTAKELEKKGKKADLLIANNVLAHVPDLNDFVGGFTVLLKPHGVATFEFPHLLQLVNRSQFDTIYHEHFSYFSLHTVRRIFAAHGLTVFDVQELPTHGGSLRIFAAHTGDSKHPVMPSVASLLEKEKEAGLTKLSGYRGFEEHVREIKRSFLAFLIQAKRDGKTVVGYGAPAKGNTFLNYCGIRTDFLDYTIDKNPHKQKHLLPGTRIPIVSAAHLKETRPDYVLILPWNLKEEIMQEIGFIRNWGGRFVVAIPNLEILSSAARHSIHFPLERFSHLFHAVHSFHILPENFLEKLLG